MPYAFIATSIALTPLVISGPASASGNVGDSLSLQLVSSHPVASWSVASGEIAIDGAGLATPLDNSTAGVKAGVARVTDDRGRTATYAVSFTFAAVSGDPPQNLTKPQKPVGITNPGQVLTGNAGTWLNSDSEAYQWWKADLIIDAESGEPLIDDDGETIYDEESKILIGTDDDQYTTVVGDVDFVIGYDVTATNVNGSTTESCADVTNAISSPQLTDVFRGSFGLVQNTATPSIPIDDIGSGAAPRVVSLFYETQGGEAVTHDGMAIEIGGNSYPLTKIEQALDGASTFQQSFWRGSVPVGNGAAIAKPVCGTGAFAAAHVIHVSTDGRPVTPTAVVRDSSGALSQGITIGAGGALLGGAMASLAGTPTCSWSHGTELYDLKPLAGRNQNSSGIRYTTAGTITLVATWSSGTPQRMIAAALGPTS